MISWPSKFILSLQAWRQRGSSKLGSALPVANQNALPSNLRSRDICEERIKEDVQYCIRIGEEYLALLNSSGMTVKGKTILEIGPGINFGCAAILACHGASMIVSDRYLAPWDEYYHSAFYKALMAWMKKHRPDLQLKPLKDILSLGRDNPSILCVPQECEALSSIEANSVDGILSNAVLEHLNRPGVAFAEMFRISRPGALGIHQVDFRDHRDFSRPLEYLLLSAHDFESMFAERNGECGRQIRPAEMESLFCGAGFVVDRFDGNISADDAYLCDLIPRLRAAIHSPYRDFHGEGLKVISGRFFLRKPFAP